MQAQWEKMLSGADVPGGTGGLVVTPGHFWQCHQPVGANQGAQRCCCHPPEHPAGAGTPGPAPLRDPRSRLDLQGEFGACGFQLHNPTCGMQFPQQQRVRGQEGSRLLRSGLRLCQSCRGEVPGPQWRGGCVGLGEARLVLPGRGEQLSVVLSAEMSLMSAGAANSP